MKKKVGVIGVIATCDECGKEFQSYKNAQALAAQHAKKYLHIVRGEVTVSFIYYGKEEV